ncbi:MAG: VWA domain-containing protein [Ruminococcus sp.]|nr:VWA domain-containing protein [Ruminococcus sp.]
MKRPRILTTLLALVIAGTAAIDSFCIYDVYGREVKGAAAAAAENKSDEDKEKDELQKESEAQEGMLLQLANEGNVSFSPAQLGLDNDFKVLDSKQALEFLQQIGDRFGIENAEEEYTIEAEGETKDSHLYFLQQKFKDIPVYGSTITMEADNEGNVRGVEGKHVKIDEDTSTEPTILVDEAKKIADAYAQTKLNYAPDDYTLTSGGVVYDPKKSGDVVLCYSYYVTSPSTGMVRAVIMVDATTGEISGTKPMINSEMITLNGYSVPNIMPKGQSGKEVSLKVWKDSDTSYELRSEDAKISVHVCDRNKHTYTEKELRELSVCTYDPNESGWKDIDNKVPDPNAVDALANLEKVDNLFSGVFMRKGMDNTENSRTLDVYVGVQEFEGIDWTDNAAIVGGEYMIVGPYTENPDGTVKKASCSSYLDVMAHEYTHAVLSHDSTIDRVTYDEEAGQKYETSIQSAIHEGYADIFGEFADDYANDGELNGNADWKSAYRDYSNPAVKQYSDYTEFTTDGHDGGFLISSPVYRAVQKKVSAKKLASLYYYSMPFITGQTDFTDLRNMLEKRAAFGNAEGHIMNNFDEEFYFTDAELEGIIDSFDEVGIPSLFGKRLNKGGKMIVYDKDNNPCEDYHLKVVRLYDRTNEPLIDEDVKKKEFKLPDELPNGLYRVILTDTEDAGLEYTYDIIVNDQNGDNKSAKYEDEAKFFTKFGSKEREVVMVLDVSGSMSGEPITQTRLSAQKFVNTVLGESPATKISIVTYSDSASTVIESSNKKSTLVRTIGGLHDGGGTNIYDGLQKANDILERSKAPKKQIVLMSDGYPNEGKSENGSYAQPCIDYADELKSKDILIYSLGFFHSLSGSERDECSALMSAIATPGYYFEVGSASDVQFVFNDLADQVSGGNYIYIRIACPVDVLVKYKDQILSSAKKTFNTRTDFGTLSFDTEKGDEKDDDDDDSSSSKKKKKSDDSDEESGSTSSNDEVKILRLKDGVDYEICINGTGKGKMDYSISYPNEDGDYKDVRKFNDVPITKNTVISTNTNKNEDTELNVDSDGDGIFDMIYTAKEDSKAVLKNDKFKIIAIIAISAILLVLIVAEVLLIIKRYKSNQVCHKCGAKLGNAKKFCNQCGTKAVKTRLIFPSDGRPKQKKGVIIAKLVVIAIFAGSAAIVLYLYRSPATTVYKQLRSGKPASAQQVYESAKIEKSTIQQKYLTHALNRYIDKASTAHEDGKYTDDEFNALLNGAISLDVDDITDKAEEYLDEKAKDSKDSDSSKSDSSAADSSSDSDESED